MKIDSILLENFGLYGNRRFRFDGQPLVLIYGGNETGKTTALNGLRQALFGFPHNSAYLTGKPMSAEATVTLRDGRQVRFSRQKRRNDGFSATVDNKLPLTENQWSELVSGLDLKSYQSLFGFSLEELRNGEKALAYAPLEDALFGSGFGGLARLQQVQERIENFLAMTLKRNGVSGTINSKLAEIEAAEKQLESVITLPSDIQSLRDRLAEAHQAVERLTEEANQLRRAYQRSQRLQAALPRAIEYRQASESLRNLQIPTAVDGAFQIQWNVTCSNLAGLKNELNAEKRRLSVLEMELAQLPDEISRPENDRTEFQRLTNEARQIGQVRQQVAEDNREYQELQLELTEALRKLGWSRSEIKWRSIQLDLNQRAELDGAAQQFASLKRRLSECQARWNLASEQLSQIDGDSVANLNSVVDDENGHVNGSEAATQLSPEDIEKLECFLRELQSAEKYHHQLSIRDRELSVDRVALACKSRLEKALNASLAKLPTNLDLDGDVDWAIPSASEIAKRQQNLATAKACYEQVLAQLKTCEKEIELRQIELSDQQASVDLPTLRDLELLWKQRDSMVEQWREELATPLLASTVTLDERKERLSELQSLHRQADNAVRAMLASIDQFSAIAGLQRQIDSQQSRVIELRLQADQAQTAISNAQKEWKTIWSGVPLSQNLLNTESTEQISGPLDDYRQYREHRLVCLGVKSELATATIQRDLLLSKLQNAWPQSLTVPTSLAHAATQIGKWRSEVSARLAQHKLRLRLAAAQSKAAQEIELVGRESTVCREHFAKTMLALDLPESWPIDDISGSLDSLARCQTLASRIDKLRSRLDAATSRIGAFSSAVVGYDSQTAKSGTPEQWVLARMAEYDEREKSLALRNEVLRKIDTCRVAIANREGQIVEREQKLLQMVHIAGGASIGEVQSWNQRASDVFQLRSRVDQLAAALEASADGMNLPDFLNELSTLDAASVAAVASTQAAQLSAIEASKKEAMQQLGALSRELELHEQSSVAAQGEQSLKRLRSELVDLSEQWAIHRLAGELLARTIDRFTRDHEPQLLKHTRRFFAELTDERYSVVEHDSGKHGGFAVRDHQGHAWQPDKLSTGTREQLYLAIRLAFITHFNEQHEPLPVILDDCFVNFDDTRARIALRTMIHWQESVQTILLSCHWRSVEALAELAPETPVITIATGDVISARQLADSAVPIG